MKHIIAIVIAVFIVILALSVYLSPNDLNRCDSLPEESGECAPADVIVAVSGGDTIARTNYAIELYQNDWADQLLFSGAAMDKTGPSNAAVMRLNAIERGVPASVILTEEVSETTRQNAELTRSIIRENEFNRIILVTSGYHQRRAALEFDSLVDRSITIVNAPVREDLQWSSFWWLKPRGWYLAMSELVKIVVLYVGGSR